MCFFVIKFYTSGTFGSQKKLKFRILATNDSDFQVKVKESLLMLHDEPYLIDSSHVKLYFNDIYSCYSSDIKITILI